MTAHNVPSGKRHLVEMMTSTIVGMVRNHLGNENVTKFGSVTIYDRESILGSLESKTRVVGDKM